MVAAKKREACKPFFMTGGEEKGRMHLLEKQRKERKNRTFFSL